MPPPHPFQFFLEDTIPRPIRNQQPSPITTEGNKMKLPRILKTNQPSRHIPRIVHQTRSTAQPRTPTAIFARLLLEPPPCGCPIPSPGSCRKGGIPKKAKESLPLFSLQSPPTRVPHPSPVLGRVGNHKCQKFVICSCLLCTSVKRRRHLQETTERRKSKLAWNSDCAPTLPVKCDNPTPCRVIQTAMRSRKEQRQKQRPASPRGLPPCPTTGQDGAPSLVVT